jgi:hypothetical protein
MLSFNDATPIYLFTPPTDMRKSFDGLCGLVALYGMDVTATDGSTSGAASGATSGSASGGGGGLFVFLNRRRDRMKVMYFDTDGLVIWYKRLEQGCYELPPAPGSKIPGSKIPGSANPTGRSDVIITASQLRCILDGIDLSSVKRRKRYVPSNRKNSQGVTDDERITERTTATARDDDRPTSGGDRTA